MSGISTSPAVQPAGPGVALQPVIDTARNQFLQEFLAKSPTMVDYLHLEMVRSLAHDEDRLLGHNYPGPMV